MIELLKDQVDLIDSVKDKIRQGKRSVLIQAATGSGKTVVSSSIVHGAFNKGKSAIFIVPRRDLLRQTSETFNKFNIPHSFIAAGKHYNPKSQIHIASKDTLISRLDEIKKYDLAIVDESHFGGAGLDKIIQHLKRDSMLLGLSATPWDMAGKGMLHQYEDMVCGKSVGWLIDNNRLSKYKAFAPSHIDLSNIDIVGGDYAKGQLSEKMEADIVLIGNTVKHYKEHAYGRRGVTFCVSRKHSELVAQEYRNAGIPAVHMDGETPEEVRIKVAKAFARGEIMQLCNAELLTFGYDLSSVSGMDVCIEVINDCQPTKSLAKQLQKWGRGLRYDGSEHLFFDHANNFETHGLPCQDREWSLDGRKKRKRDSNDERSIPVRQCSQCYHAHKPAPVCPNCGYVYPIQSRTAEEIDVKLSEVEIVREKKEKRMEVGKARTMEDLYRIANERGYAKGWVFKQAQIKRIRE